MTIPARPKRTIRRFTRVLLLMMLAACARYHAEPLSPAERAASIEARSLDNPRLLKFIALEQKKSTSDKPWGLSNLTLAALYYHPDLDIARAKLSGAEAAVMTARQRPNPTLGLTNVFGESAATGSIPPGAVPITVGPLIELVLETFGKRQDRTAQARHLADSARWDLATAGWQVRGRVRSALLGLWGAQRQLALSRQQLALQQQLVDLLQHRFAAGAASSLDLARERIKRTQITFAIRDLERTAADAWAELAAAIGVPLRALDGINLSLDAFDHPDPLLAHIGTGELRRDALTKRTDVEASLDEYQATQSALRLAVANQYPNIILGPGYEYDFGVNKYILDLGSELPIFQQNQGPIAEALARRQQAAADFTALQLRIIGAIDRAATAYRTATQSVATGDALLADETRRAPQVERSFRAGQVDRPTLVTAELEAAATVLSRFKAVVQQRQAIGALEDALQLPLFDPGHLPAVPEQNPRIARSGSAP